MRIGGKEVSGPAEEYLVLPRPTGEDIVFKAQAVMSLDEFETKVPEPKPKARLEAGGWREHFDDPAYLEAVGKRAELRFAYIILKSLEPSEIEWDTVKPDEPSSWLNWQEDLRNAGLSQTEVNRVINCVSSANSLDEGKLELARQNFLRGLAQASGKSSSPTTEQASTPSGEPASDSVSDPQK